MPERHHSLTVDGQSDPFHVVEFQGWEGISQLFQFEIGLAAPADVAFADVVGKKATLTVTPALDAEPRLFHGIISRLERWEEGRTYTAYRATLVPNAWKLQHRVDSRIFQEMSAVDVITKVLDGAGLASGDDYRLSTTGTYSAREYCVQYRESDWDFVCRLMEEEGIAYFFEHTDSAHVLVLADGTSSHAAISGDATLLFRPPVGALAKVANESHVARFYRAEEIRPGKVTLRDFDFKKPNLLLESENEGEAHLDLELYDFPAKFEVPAVGDARAGLRLEEALTLRSTGQGTSACARLCAGFTFELAEHPFEAHNTGYLVTRVEHWGHVPGQGAPLAPDEDLYANRFEVVPKTVVFRPQRVTRRPIIEGVQTAIVVGPSGEEIYTDEHGRVKVQFHWDRLGKSDDKSSCWIRVAQVWAGTSWGAMYIPRVTHEVVVAFLEGDPDRPLIVGRVYHAANPPPYRLPDEMTKSTIKSSTSKGGAGFNELRFEDKKESEEVFLHAQKDLTIKVLHDKNQEVGHDETLVVKNDRTKTVQHDQTVTIKHDSTLTVENDRTATVKHDDTLTVENNRTVTVKVDHSEKVEGKQTVAITKDQSITVSENQTVAVTKAQTVTVGTDATTTIDGASTLTVKGNSTATVKGDLSETVEKGMTLAVTNDLGITGKNSSLKVDQKHSLEAGEQVTIKTGQVTITLKSDGTIEMSGASLAIKCSSGDVKIDATNVEVKAKGTAKIEANGPVTVKGSATMEVNASGPLNLKGAMIGIG